MEKESIFPKIELEKKIITFTDLIDPNRTIPKKYRELINEQERYEGWYTTSHSLNWEGLVEDDDRPLPQIERTIDLFKKHLSGDVLIDLGAGSAKTIELLSKKLEVQTYVRIDQFYNIQHNKIKEANISYSETDTQKPHIITVNADMLTVATLTGDDTGSFVINGIDGYVLKNINYCKALANEIVRATRPNGIIFGLNSEIIEYDLIEISNQRDSALVKIDNIPDSPKRLYPLGSFFFIKKQNKTNL